MHMCLTALAVFSGFSRSLPLELPSSKTFQNLRKPSSGDSTYPLRSNKIPQCLIRCSTYYCRSIRRQCSVQHPRRMSSEFRHLQIKSPSFTTVLEILAMFCGTVFYATKRTSSAVVRVVPCCTCCDESATLDIVGYFHRVS